MDFSKEKYEYMLHTWGGFYNTEFQRIHGNKMGYFFFDTMEELQAYVDELKIIEEALDARVLMIEIREGKQVRYKTIATMKFIYDGIAYDYEHDFGFAYPVEPARFFFEEGNGACDCNRSDFLRNKYGLLVNQLGCGHTIELKDLSISQVKPDLIPLLLSPDELPAIKTCSICKWWSNVKIPDNDTDDLRAADHIGKCLRILHIGDEFNSLFDNDKSTFMAGTFDGENYKSGLMTGAKFSCCLFELIKIGK